MRLLRICLVLTVVAVGLLGCSGDGLMGPTIPFSVDVFLEMAGSGNLAVVKKLVDAGMPVNAVGRSVYATIEGDEGWTALHCAAYGGHLEVAEYLVGEGADITAKSRSGDTPKYYAEDQKHEDVAEYLKSQGG